MATGKLLPSPPPSPLLPPLPSSPPLLTMSSPPHWPLLLTMSSPLLQVSDPAPALLAVQPLEGFTGCCWNRSFPSVTAHSSSFSPALSSASTDIHLLSGQPDGGRMGKRRATAYTHTYTQRLRQSDNLARWVSAPSQCIANAFSHYYYHRSTRRWSTR